MSKAGVPDGGFGWVIVVSGSLSQSVNAGFEKTKSLFFQELLSRFRQSAAATAWCISMGNSCKFFLSPLAGALCDRFGHRKVAAIGTLLTVLGYILTGFSPTLQWTYLAFSLRGIGFSLFTVARVSVLNLYFSKNRGKANSLSYALISFGAVYMAPLSTFLYSEYGFSGTLLITGAMVLNNIPSALLFRPLRIYLSSEVECSRSEEKVPEVKNGDIGTSATKVSQVDNSPNENGMGINSSELNRMSADENICNSIVTLEIGKNRTKTNDALTYHVTIAENTLEKKNDVCLKRIAEWTGFHVLTEKRMILLVLFLMSVMYNASTSGTVIASHCLQKGFKLSQVTLMLTICSGVEVGVRALSGFVFDHKLVRPRRPLVLGGIGIFTGTMAICVPLPTIGPLIMAIWIIHQVSSAVSLCQWSTVMSDIVPRSLITSGVGVTRFFQGIGALLGPLVAGFLMDYTGSYRYAFFLSGFQVLIFSSAFIALTQMLGGTKALTKAAPK